MHVSEKVAHFLKSVRCVANLRLLNYVVSQIDVLVEVFESDFLDLARVVLFRLVGLGLEILPV